MIATLAYRRTPLRACTLRCLATLIALAAAASAAGADTQFEELPVAGGVMLIDWRGDFSVEQRARLRTWLESVGDTVTLLHGSLPRARIRIELTSYPTSSGAIPFGRVKRKSPQGLEFFVNASRPLDEFVSDWTPYHEFSHLFIPYPGSADVWFSEGLASYYQNVLQYRAGLLTEQQAWQKLHNGFERGRLADRDADLTLGELSTRMREKRAYMRVYWSGALYFLEAELALRERSAGRVTLDTILREFGDCCLEREQRWTGRMLAAEFDRLAAADIFVPLYDQYEQTTAIPDYAGPLAAAGVNMDDQTVTIAKPGFLQAYSRAGTSPVPSGNPAPTP